MSRDPGELGAFLRARRERVTPAEVGLPAAGRRRTPGLRREELALLAGISVDYLVRLEQGRDRSPSMAVADALAAALRLDGDARRHLLKLGSGMSPDAACPLSTSDGQAVSATVRAMVDRLHPCPRSCSRWSATCSCGTRPTTG